MKTLGYQINFNVKRVFLRNFSYSFFTILMPIGFFILFTKVLISGNNVQKLIFAKQYLGSMIVYSVLINAMFGLGQIMQSDRQQNLLLALSLTPKGTKYYYISIGIIMSLVNMLSIILMQIVGKLTWNINLSLTESVSMIVIAILGTLPIMGLGVLSSFAKTPQLTSIIANLTVFPLAIISGLWWPISMMPNWVQSIGKVTPTYLTSKMINLAINNQSLPTADIMGILIWTIIVLVLLFVLIKVVQKSGELKNG
ncbi:ABC transporter permease [Lentilactobacillus diolivorans]|mgnify:CR=1 FL=1|uniref:Multidrug ABC superfamily ATP binding cassette transporter, permease protein n=2 Tax=Lentilactobacillus diolivorans TaxID=179838 RepID=A0A0R1S1T4_9LACO|nr:ABC transporter permease [Lentilactobacillus diolivorans]KRL63190.1 multidrug ABC superfamily ATP binding cassette transporter, permease protein [Lentilactobacillus diolivorans DSM 14421]GEP24439.1 multidrug ABC transporter permease [Lentilactobacillus diolivorans]